MLDRKVLFILGILLASLVPLSAVSAQNDKNVYYDIIIVRNDNLIDYIVALPYAAAFDIPILPVNPTQLDEQTKAQLYSYAQLGWKEILIVGNTNAVSAEVENELMRMGFNVKRVGGEYRTDTAERLATHFYSHSDIVFLASSSDYGSALVAAKFAMEYKAPLLLTLDNDLSEPAENALKELGVTQVVMVGAGLSSNIQEKLEAEGYTVFWYAKYLDTLPRKPKEEAPESPYKYLIMGAVLALVLSLPVVVYYGKKRWSANVVPVEVLTEKERIVIEAILKAGGTVKQEDLPEMTNYSRPTVSRIIQELEKKQLISREKVGKTFIVKLIKEIRL
ncbi:hypothetical protein PAP_05260 [Palaeococcus pacificus DY20341]|uniref:DUF7343 domain-containing protein n=1 Tax=Palaeococcus pacificus DY20341 TaxID=1343739 RepID=A0A075LTL6_9EURY|nr:cell wall-binding repeat-containing protein [Palaeococcus pacificus]AIF69461.1 hypothetical protein PAP_05260 [Palaeococcus pacificus DY20341]